MRTDIGQAIWKAPTTTKTTPLVKSTKASTAVKTPTTTQAKVTTPTIKPVAKQTTPVLKTATPQKTATAISPYNVGNPAPGYSDDDYRSPMYGEMPTDMAFGEEAPLDPTSPTPTDGTDMDFFNKLFEGYQQQSDARMKALEELLTKQFEDMNGKFKYQQSAFNPASFNQNARDGIHLFDPGTSGSASGGATSGVPVGYTQSGNANNEALYKYLQSMWNGGF